MKRSTSTFLEELCKLVIIMQAGFAEPKQFDAIVMKDRPLEVIRWVKRRPLLVIEAASDMASVEYCHILMSCYGNFPVRVY